MTEDSPEIDVRDWPEAVVMTCALFALIPLLAMLLVDVPWVVAVERGMMGAILATFVYWIGPLGGLGLIVMRHRLLVPWYAAHCAALGAHILLSSAGRPFWLNGMESLAIIVMAVTGLLLLNEDVLYPFVADNPHAWRKAPRLLTNKMLRIINVENRKSCHVIVADASLTGMGLYGANVQLTEALAGVSNGDYCELVMGAGKSAHVLDARIRWTKVEDDKVMTIGVAALDPKAMARFLRGLTPISFGGKMSHWFARHWVNPRFRYALLALWVGSFLTTHLLPAYLPDTEKMTMVRTADDPTSPEISGY